MKVHPRAYPFLLILFACSLYFVLDLVFNVLHLPYFWDELNVYFRAASHQYRFGLSLMPGSIPDEFSRGHPLLVPFYFALNFKLFGFNPITAHIAAAALSVLGFVFLYFSLKKIILPHFALIICMAMMIQPAFLAQSILILPEMPLFTFTSAAVCFFIYNKKMLSSVFVVLALQTKESALILPIALLFADVLISKKFSFKSSLILFVLPILSFGIFLLIQYQKTGYYFYKLHTDLAKFEWYFIGERWNGVKSFVFMDQAHWLFLIFTFFIIYKWKSISKKELIFPIIFIGGLCFSSLNYFLPRYLCFFTIPYYAWVSAKFLEIVKNNNLAKYTGLSLLLVLPFFYWKTDKYDDINFSYTDHVKNLQETLNYLEKPMFKDTKIKIDFPFYPCYMDDGNGYIVNKNYQIILTTNESSDYKVYTFPGNMHDTSQLNSNDSLVKEIPSGIAFSRIYKTGSLQK